VYKYFTKIPEVDVIKKRSPILKNSLYAVGFGSIFCITFLTILGVGFWIGMGVGIIGFALMGTMIEWMIKFSHNDGLNYLCPGCSHSTQYIFKDDLLALGKQQRLRCAGCGQISQIEVS
jgi:hypothetical protein